MCGIAGIYKLNNSRINLENLINELNNSINHRGPDDRGIYINEDKTIYLTHSRLSIQDLSSQGHQPMISASNRYVIIFNGEIYNHIFLRSKINKQYIFKGRSDTETLLALVEIYGLEKTLEMIDGMYAFCIYDLRLKKIFLVRDKFGEKPLYYYSSNSLFIFSSELKSFINHKFINLSINKEVLENYFNYGFSIDNKSIYKGIVQLAPASILEIDLKTKNQSIKNYWSLSDLYLNREKYEDFSSNSIKSLDLLLEKSVKSRMLSDAPLGIFLSGGIDSSLIAYYASKNTNKIDTFSISFDDDNFDESFYSKKVSEFLGTNHHDYRFQRGDIVNIVKKLPEIYDEPFSDPAAIPTIMLSNAVSKRVKVALSGDGADEIFYGYNRYRALLLNEYLSGPSKKFIILLLKILNKVNLNTLVSFIPRNIAIKNLDDEVKNLLALLSEKDELLISYLFSKNEQPYNRLNKNKFNIHSSQFDFLNSINKMNMLDLDCYLTNDLLLKTDRASMANSLEVRLPFLSEDILNFSFKYKHTDHFNLFKNKIFLRKLSKNKFPNHIINRPKMGFGIPISDILRSELMQWGDALINTKTIDEIDYSFYRKIWHDHQTKKCDYQHILWKFLTFQNWYCSIFK